MVVKKRLLEGPAGGGRGKEEGNVSEFNHSTLCVSTVCLPYLLIYYMWF
jgi:hypothetical protein